MPDRSGQPQNQPTPTQPQPNQIIAQPATVAACQQDYANGASVRATLTTQEARRR